MSGECMNWVNGPTTAPRLATMESNTAWSLGATWSLLVIDGRRGMVFSLVSHACEVQLRICGAHMRFGQAELAPHDVGAFHHRHALIMSDAPAQAFAAEATVGGDHQLLGRNEFQRAADQAGHVFGWFDH